MDQLLRVLQHQRDLLEEMRYRLLVVLSLLAAGEERFITHATDELDVVADELQQTEAARALAVAEVADQFGISEDGVTLSALIAAAPASAKPMLTALQDRLVQLMDEIEQRRRLGSELAGVGLEHVRTALESLATGHRDRQYRRDGASGAYRDVPPTRFDQRA